MNQRPKTEVEQLNRASRILSIKMSARAAQIWVVPLGCNPCKFSRLILTTVYETSIKLICRNMRVRTVGEMIYSI